MIVTNRIPRISRHPGKSHEPMLSVKDIAEMWGVSVATVYGYFHNEVLQPPVSDTTTYGARSSSVYPKSQVIAWRKRIQENKK